MVLLIFILARFEFMERLCQALKKNVKIMKLEGVIRESDTLARMSGDEFAILLSMVTTKTDIIGVVKKIQKTFIEPFSLEGLILEVQVCIGIAIFPQHGKEVDTIVQRANVALCAAKQDIKKFTLYSSNLDKHNPHRLTLMGELRQAIENNELFLHYQPKINLQTHRVSGVEPGPKPGRKMASAKS